jgi:hypothetical protein
MKKNLIVVALMMALAVAAYTGIASAADVNATIKGKCSMAKEAKACSITVSEATDADGKAIADLKGKTLAVACPCTDCSKCCAEKCCDGKEVSVKGVVKDGATFAPEACCCAGKDGCPKKADAKSCEAKKDCPAAASCDAKKAESCEKKAGCSATKGCGAK